MEKQALFSIIFKDGSHFIGKNNYLDTGWKVVPHKKIKRIFFLLPDGNYLCLSEYEKYNRITEATKDLNGINKGILKIENLYFMGLRNGIVDSYRVTMFNKGNNRYKIGDITKRQYKWEDIKNKYTGWK